MSNFFGVTPFTIDCSLIIAESLRNKNLSGRFFMLCLVPFIHAIGNT